MFWLVISGLAALFAACVLGGVTYLIQRRRGSIRTRWMLGAVALPFVSIAYMWGIFVLYSIHCEAIRDVDLGIGDSWRVPLIEGYRLSMIDTPEQAYVMAPGDRQLHHDLTRIGATDHFVAVEDKGQLFLIDGRSGGESRVATESDLQTALRGAGEPAVELLPPGDFYNEHRWGTADAVAAAIAFMPPWLATLVFLWRLMRSHRHKGASVV